MRCTPAERSAFCGRQPCGGGTTGSAARVVVDGKFFRVGGSKFFPKGLAYGPFEPNTRREPFPEPVQAERDFRQIRELGANLLRVYDVPPTWLLDSAHREGLKLLVDVPWPKHLLFLDSRELQRHARDAVRDAVRKCRGHPAVFAFSVVNEIPPDIVRWSGTRRVERFIEALIGIAKEVDPDCLCTFTSFPPTEFLQPRNTDFTCFNVYLHRRQALTAYLARLQMLADAKPLVLGEFGMDSLREGEEPKCEFLEWQIETIFRSGLAGAIVFSYTDDWFRGGEPILDWAFGLTTRERRPKPSFHAVQRSFRAAPYFPLPRTPKVSVVVATYNGARTLRTCLESLERLNYPDYEVVVVDDGSTDATWDTAQQFPSARCLRHENLGLAAARNTGLAAATGEIVAFTDSDCRVDEDWLYYLVGDLVRSEFVGMGGHNFLPNEDGAVPAAVMVSPGGPAHVMLDDQEAEHVPGCNMAFYKWALKEIGGFDPLFRKAGDDVDVCWRLQQQGHKLGFSPAGFVWHYRRSTARAYLMQQSGYGEAEDLLARRHPECFTALGQNTWRGRIYGSSKFGVILKRPRVYHGAFGGGLFQRLYARRPSHTLMLSTSLECHLVVTGPLFALSLWYPWLRPLAVASLLFSLSVCALAAVQADLPKRQRRVWSRPLVAFLFFAQPIERALARYRSQLRTHSLALPLASQRHHFSQKPRAESARRLTYWSDGNVDRRNFLDHLSQTLQQEGWEFRADTGWADHDFEILDARWSRVRLTTVTEQLDHGKLNVHCRLRTSCSLAAYVLFGTLCVVQVAFLSLVAQRFPWTWAVLLTLPLVVGFLKHDQARLRRVVAALLDETANRLKLKKPHGS